MRHPASRGSVPGDSVRGERPVLARAGSPVPPYYTVTEVWVFMRSIASLALALLFISGALGQSGQAGTVVTGTVVNWEALPYSQNAHMTINHVVYTIHLGDVHYRITRNNPKAELNIGQQVDCRIEGNSMFVHYAKGKEVKYDIAGQDGETGPTTR